MHIFQVRKEGHCQDTETSTLKIGTLKHGEEKFLKDCQKVTCNKDGSFTIVT